MAYAAKRGKNRCPTHPGALLEMTSFPPPVGPRRKSLACSGSRASTCTTSWGNESRCPDHRRASWQALRRWCGNLDPDAERLRYLACGTNRRCQPYSDHQGKGRLRAPASGINGGIPFRFGGILTRAVSCRVKSCYRAGLNSQDPRHDRPASPRDPRSPVRFRQDRADRVRSGAGRPRRRTGLHRRHREGDRRCRAEGQATSPSSPASPK